MSEVVYRQLRKVVHTDNAPEHLYIGAMVIIQTVTVMPEIGDIIV